MIKKVGRKHLSSVTSNKLWSVISNANERSNSVSTISLYIFGDGHTLSHSAHLVSNLSVPGYLLLPHPVFLSRMFALLCIRNDWKSYANV